MQKVVGTLLPAIRLIKACENSKKRFFSLKLVLVSNLLNFIASATCKLTGKNSVSVRVVFFSSLFLFSAVSFFLFLCPFDLYDDGDDDDLTCIIKANSPIERGRSRRSRRKSLSFYFASQCRISDVLSSLKIGGT